MLPTCSRLIRITIIAFATLPFAGPRDLPAQQGEREARIAELSDRYEKSEHRVAMRDGKTLYLAVYAPRNATGELPILLKRTPYSCAPYGPECDAGDDRPEPDARG